MMADENVNTGDENKSTTVWHVFDEDESGDKWFTPYGKSNYLIIVFHYIASINTFNYTTEIISGV